MPVLPLVGSTMVVRPGVMRPSRSAASIMLTPIRSFTEPQGLKNSSLAATSASIFPVTRLSLTRGVFPVNSVMFPAILMSHPPKQTS